MTLSEFLLKLHTTNRMVKQLSGAPADAANAGFTDEQLKHRFWYAMLKSWIDYFDNANMTLANSSLADIKTYTDKQSIKDPFVEKT